jgi:hypothetical protein
MPTTASFYPVSQALAHRRFNFDTYPGDRRPEIGAFGTLTCTQRRFCPMARKTATPRLG